MTWVEFVRCLGIVIVFFGFVVGRREWGFLEGFVFRIIVGWI